MLENDLKLDELEREKQLKELRNAYSKYHFRLTNVDMVTAVISSLR